MPTLEESLTSHAIYQAATPEQRSVLVDELRSMIGAIVLKGQDQGTVAITSPEPGVYVVTIDATVEVSGKAGFILKEGLPFSLFGEIRRADEWTPAPGDLET